MGAADDKQMNTLRNFTEYKYIIYRHTYTHTHNDVGTDIVSDTYTQKSAIPRYKKNST